MSKRTYRRVNLKEVQSTIKIMQKPEYTHQKDTKQSKKGEPNFYKLSLPVSKGGIGINKRTLMNWWAKRASVEETKFKSKRFKIDSPKCRALFPEMERELSDWITTKRAAYCCISGVFIQVKAKELLYSV